IRCSESEEIYRPVEQRMSGRLEPPLYATPPHGFGIAPLDILDIGEGNTGCADNCTGYRIYHRSLLCLSAKNFFRDREGSQQDCYHARECLWQIRRYQKT